MQRFANKVAVVTASTEGIGFAIAKRLAQEGAKVVVSSRKQKNIDKALKELLNEKLPSTTSLLGVPCHVGKAEDRLNLIKQTVDQFGKIDVLVSNAAVNPVFGEMIDNTTDSVWDKLFDTNVKSAFFLVKEALPHLKSNANILFTSSITAYVPEKTIGTYSVTKTALLGLVKALSQELGPQGIRVNGVAPGIIQTKFAGALVESPEIAEHTIALTSLKRLGVPEDIGGPAAFLCSDDAKYVTGEILCVTGGMPSRL